MEEHVEEKRSLETDSQGVSLLLSAQNKDALKLQIDSFIEYLEANDKSLLKDICYTQAVGDEKNKYRLAIVGKDKEKIIRGLNAVKAGELRLGCYTSDLCDHQQVECVFIFTGHGAQYVGMGKWMYENYSVFKSTLDQCEILFQKLCRISLLQIMFEGTDNDLIPATIAHPAIFSFEVALANQLMAWGIKPACLIGHSVGEYAAAHIAGVFDLNSAFHLVYKRSQLIESIVDPGQMMAILASLEIVNQSISETGAAVDIAAVNGENAVVISGYSNELLKIEAWCENCDVGTCYLSVSSAAHSSIMEKVKDQFRIEAEKYNYQPPLIDIISNLTGAMAAKDTFTAGYWAEHLRNTVLFYNSVKNLVQRGSKCFLEIGPKSTLSSLIQLSFPGVFTQCFSQPKFERIGMMNCLSLLYTLGNDIDWESVYSIDQFN